MRPNWLRTWLEKSTFAKLVGDYLRILPDFGIAIEIKATKILSKTTRFLTYILTKLIKINCYDKYITNEQHSIIIVFIMFLTNFSLISLHSSYLFYIIVILYLHFIFIFIILFISLSFKNPGKNIKFLRNFPSSLSAIFLIYMPFLRIQNFLLCIRRFCEKSSFSGWQINGLI